MWPLKINSSSLHGTFSAPVDLSCSSSSADVSCSLSASSITPDAAGASVTLNVTAAASSGGLYKRSTPNQFAIWLGTLPIFGIIVMAAGRRKRWQTGVLLLLLLTLVAVHIGCGGGGGTTPASQNSNAALGARTVTVTVTGTSGTLQHSSAVAVTIQ